MKKVFAIALTTVLFSGVTQACTKPTAPALPDASTAVTAQMVKAKNEVKSYIASAESYLECVADAKKHNKMVDDMKTVASTFNTIVREYKQRMANA